ncbi:short-chain dehydrogenase, putative [Talaromyces stipitatus ATCC 10500]|uniref:Short-chain dehydrogenase, putative n=1 Tax=Talaromyces stipitatus (strain ATCC 10500 / CBS 375.48 / QM 6759 / NRRL 1006) TaxID=441959 RepID=B8MLS1_TALSN|nr:short-chain dehydrogenase, putative [Talaromyces stipitatus ATCC 10500]EED13643.1 short-chain dehydrogenase, putative [Talaromyces stipitatus ATCC 10500]
MSAPVWLITGTSNGLGLVLALRVLRAGHRVVASVRNKTKAAAAVQQIEQAGGSVIEMDMTESQASISSKVQAIGRIDYLVNNAGYSILAPCETITEKDATLQLATNFFGPLYTLQAALPAMRAQRSGTIVNVSSVAAQDPLPACSLYSASKAALEAASESLAKEVAPHNIRVLIVEPGNFRTNFVSALAQASPDPTTVPPHYDDPVGNVIRKFLTVHGKQMGDPEKGADRIFEACTGTGMAGHLTGNVSRLVLGSDAHTRMKKSSEKFVHELSLQEETAASTAFE